MTFAQLGLDSVPYVLRVRTRAIIINTTYQGQMTFIWVGYLSNPDEGKM